MSKGLAILSFDYFEDSMAAKLFQNADNMKSLNLAPGIMAEMLQIQPYQPLRLIYSQLLKLLDWGFYFAFSFDDTPYLATIKEYNQLMAKYILNHDKEAFADTVQHNYYYIFKIMQNHLLKMGVGEAQNIRLP